MTWTVLRYRFAISLTQLGIVLTRLAIRLSTGLTTLAWRVSPDVRTAAEDAWAKRFFERK